MTTELYDSDALSRVVAVLNGKGGCGKTSVVANVAGQLAAAGYQVLTVDLDLGANLKLDLGYIGNPGDDNGTGLVDAIWRNQELPIIRGVRERLDVIPGGRQLEMLGAIAYSPLSSELPGGGVAAEFARRLAAVAGDYDVVLLDCSPGNPVLQDLALAAARYVLIPTKTDAGGWDGLRMVGPRVKKARETNPGLTYLGAILFAHQPSATRVLAGTRDRLREVEDAIPMFEAFVRHSESAAHDCRNRGQLAHELARDVASAKRERLALLRRGGGRHRVKDRGKEPIAMPAQLAGTADSLAGDYARVARELLTRINEHEQADSLAATASR